MSFEKYLEEKFVERYPGIKDDYEDSLDRWMSNLDVSEVMIYADVWMSDYKSKIRLAIHNITK